MWKTVINSGWEERWEVANRDHPENLSRNMMCLGVAWARFLVNRAGLVAWRSQREECLLNVPLLFEC